MVIHKKVRGGPTGRTRKQKKKPSWIPDQVWNDSPPYPILNSNMIPAANRFHGHNSLRYVYTNGKAARSRLMTFKWTPNTHRKKTRIAVVVSKKVIKSAVSRNRIRRRLYEYMRLSMPNLNAVYDIVIIVSSSEVLTMPAPELAQQLKELTSQTNLY
jgi:ribonuclease P protein component